MSSRMHMYLATGELLNLIDYNQFSFIDRGLAFAALIRPYQNIHIRNFYCTAKQFEFSGHHKAMEFCYMQEILEE